MAETLTKKQIERQDEVDNAIHACLCELKDHFEAPWDAELIAVTRAAIYNVLKRMSVRHPGYPTL